MPATKDYHTSQLAKFSVVYLGRGLFVIVGYYRRDSCLARLCSVAYSHRFLPLIRIGSDCSFEDNLSIIYFVVTGVRIA